MCHRGFQETPSLCPDQCCGLIASFCSLERLSLDFGIAPDLTLKLDDLQHIYPFPLPPRLRTVGIGRNPAQPLLSRLVSIVQFPAIKIITPCSRQ